MNDSGGIREGKSTFASFLDIKNAYESVWRDGWVQNVGKWISKVRCGG